MTKEFDYFKLGEKETDYKPRKKGLGIRDAIKNKTAATPESDTFGQMFFRAIVAAAPLTKFGPIDAILRKAAMLGGTHNTKGISAPFYIDGDMPKFGPGNEAEGTHREEAERAPRSKRIDMNLEVANNVHSGHPPIEMLRETVERASYRAIMNECICRKIRGCKDYPLDLGCLFVGPAAKTCVERGIAREATLQECYDHIDRAREAGLSPSVYFVEVEEYVWGFHDADMPNFLEICFCCPCCCSAVLFEHRAYGETKRILHQGMGYSCVVDTERCIGCGACVAHCPHERIELVDGKARVRAECAGCGQCLKMCPQAALSVHKVGESKERLEDYFEKLHAQL